MIVKVGEWVKGPFANTTIEGFIVEEPRANYRILVRGIQTSDDTIPRNLRVGSSQILPKRIVLDFYTILNKEQQNYLVDLALSLKENEWANELLEKFKSPEIKQLYEVGDKKERIFSATLNRHVSLGRGEKEKLYHYYSKAKEMGMPGKLKSPLEINNSNALDAVVCSIVLITKDNGAKDYLKYLLNEENQKR